MFRGGARIVVGAAKALGFEARALEETRAAEIDRSIARRITGQWFSLDDDAMIEDHCLPAQVDDLELSPERCRMGDEFVEARQASNAIEVAVLLRCFRDDHPSLRPCGQQRVVHHRAQYGTVGDHALDTFTPVLERVPVANEVGLEHDDRTRAHEFTQRVPAWLAVVFAVEFECAKSRAHRGEDVVELRGSGGSGRELRELRVVTPRRKRRSEPLIGWLGVDETDANHEPSSDARRSPAFHILAEAPGCNPRKDCSPGFRSVRMGPGLHSVSGGKPGSIYMVTREPRRPHGNSGSSAAAHSSAPDEALNRMKL